MIKQINFRAFIKPFLFLSLSLFVGCSTVANNSILKPQEKIELKVSNNISVYYYTMAETALQNGDLELSLSLYMKADKAAPDNVYIKEIILEILALGAQYNPDKYTEIIEIGESYLERDIVSKRILEVFSICCVQLVSTVLSYSQGASANAGWQPLRDAIRRAVVVLPNIKHFSYSITNTIIPIFTLLVNFNHQLGRRYTTR